MLVALALLVFVVLAAVFINTIITNKPTLEDCTNLGGSCYDGPTCPDGMLHQSGGDAGCQTEAMPDRICCAG